MPPRSQAPGSRLRSPEGYLAFLPDPLPPELIWTPELLRALSDADRALGKLAGQGGWLPNPHLLIRPFLRREAVLSSRIEGTQATLGELLAAEAGAAVDRSPADLREVANYVVALEYGIARLRELPLSLRLVRELHARLMADVRGGQALGEFRRSQNWIGPAGCKPEEATYVPPPPAEMLEALSSWESFLHETALPPLVQIALAHYQFEAIHPFLDGNGRVGRLLIVLAFVERSLLPSPLLYLSAFFETNRQEYYDRLRGVSARGEWEEWVQYFLAGVARQAEDAVRRIERVETLLAEWRANVSDSSGRVAALVDLLAENPFWTIRRVADRLGVVYTTAQRAVGRLEAAGILTRVGDAKRDRLYCAQALLAILEETANLTPEL